MASKKRNLISRPRRWPITCDWMHCRRRKRRSTPAGVTPVIAGASSRTGSALNLRSFGLYRKTSDAERLRRRSGRGNCARLIDCVACRRLRSGEIRSRRQNLTIAGGGASSSIPTHSDRANREFQDDRRSPTSDDARAFLTKWFADLMPANQIGEARQLGGHRRNIRRARAGGRRRRPAVDVWVIARRDLRTVRGKNSQRSSPINHSAAGRSTQRLAGAALGHLDA